MHIGDRNRADTRSTFNIGDNLSPHKWSIYHWSDRLNAAADPWLTCAECETPQVGANGPQMRVGSLFCPYATYILIVLHAPHAEGASRTSTEDRRTEFARGGTCRGRGYGPGHRLRERRRD